MMRPKNIGIQMTDKALLFINGVPPKNLPDISNYSLIACSDGAFNYLNEKGFPLDKLDFISGDFDSHSGTDENVYQEKFIYTPDQDKTDFEKSLEIIKEKGFKTIHVYGGSGGEMDHFLGNLSNNPNNPMYWLVLKQIPFIVLFKGGWPVSFYNGVRSTGSILDYIHESLANSIHFEKTTTSKSVISDVQIGIKNPELAHLNFEVKREINPKEEEILEDEILEDEIPSEKSADENLSEKSGNNFITSKMMKSDGERKYMAGMYLISEKRPENKEDSYEIFIN